MLTDRGEGAPQHFNRSSEPIPPSVLAEGDWFKFAIRESGVYKITGALLEEAGINLSKVNPKWISIHGYGGGMLPQLNSAERPVDLPEISIYVSGEQDEEFDQDDFIVFYAEGPDQRYYEEASSSFIKVKNIYSDSAYYFLSFHEPHGKRIQQVEDKGSAHPKISYFDDVLLHEEDKVNILSSGRNWYGERFAPGAAMDVNFEVFDYVPDSEIKVRLQCMSTNTAPSSFTLSSNGKDVGELSLEATPKVNFDTGENILRGKRKGKRRIF